MRWLQFQLSLSNSLSKLQHRAATISHEHYWVSNSGPWPLIGQHSTNTRLWLAVREWIIDGADILPMGGSESYFTWRVMKNGQQREPQRLETATNTESNYVKLAHRLHWRIWYNWLCLCPSCHLSSCPECITIELSLKCLVDGENWGLIRSRA